MVHASAPDSIDAPAESIAHRDSTPVGLALLGFTLFYTAFFLQSLLSGRYIAPGDAFDFGLADYLASPSLWTWNLYSGYPVAADPQSLTWYPLLQLFRVLRVPWNVFMVVPYIIASTTCFALVHRLTRARLAAAFSGLAYGFSGALVGNLSHFNQVHAAAWMPLVFYGLQLIREDSTRAGTAATACAFAMMWLAGHPQLPVYAAYLAAAFVGAIQLIDRAPAAVFGKRLRWSALAMVLGLGIAAVQVIPMFELATFSRRSQASWDLYIYKAMPLRELLTLVLPYAFGFWAPDNQSVSYLGDGSQGENLPYVGLLALALAVTGCFLRFKGRRETQLWVVLGVVALLLSVGPATPLGTAFFHAPGLARFRMPTRHLFLSAFCFAIGAGFAFAELTRRRRSMRPLAMTTAGLLAVAMLIFFVFVRRMPAVATLLAGDKLYSMWTFGWPVLLLASIILLLVVPPGWGTWKRALPLASGLALLVVQLLDMASFHYRVPGYANSYDNVEPQEAQLHPGMEALRQELERNGGRILAVDAPHNPFLLPNLTRAWGMPAASGNGPLAPFRYSEALSMDPPGDIHANALSPSQTGADLYSIRYVLVPERSPLTRELADQDGRWAQVENLHYYEQDADTHYTLFRNTRARPRAWCASALVDATAAESLNAIREGRLPRGGTFDPVRVALVEPGTVQGWQPAAAPDNTSNVVARLDREPTYYVTTARQCLLVLGDTYYPWWRASLDDKPARIAQADYALMGIPIPPGTHVVRLKLRPVSVWIGAVVSVLSLIACLVVAGPRWRRAAV